MAARAGARAAVNAGPTAERVYDTLKRAIMERAFRPGDRLDPTALAEDLNASATPVREALDRLVGEDLVESRTGSGFLLPALDEPGLEDMYRWSEELLALALRSSSAAGSEQPPGDEKADASLAERTAALFLAIGARSANAEHHRAIERLNARLHAVRTIEPRILGSVGEELSQLSQALNRGERPALRRASAAYHRRRRRAAAAIVRAVYRLD